MLAFNSDVKDWLERVVEALNSARNTHTCSVERTNSNERRYDCEYKALGVRVRCFKHGNRAQLLH